MRLLSRCLILESHGLEGGVVSRYPWELACPHVLSDATVPRRAIPTDRRSSRGLSFLCAYTCSSRAWVTADGGTRGPMQEGDPAFCALRDLLRLVCRQVSLESWLGRGAEGDPARAGIGDRGRQGFGLF